MKTRIAFISFKPLYVLGAGLFAVVFFFGAGTIQALSIPDKSQFIKESWQFQSGISGGTMEKSDFVLMELPAEFFAHLRPDLADFRIANVDGDEIVPYALATDEAESGIERLSGRMFNLSSVSGKETSFLLDLGSAGAFHNAVTIETPSENFRRIVEIAGSNDQTEWRTLNPKGQIFDYTVRDINPVKVRDTTVRYPDATYRYLRATIADAGESPLAVRGATVAREMRRAAREISYTPALTRMENTQEQTTEFILDLGALGIPHRRGHIETTDRNFNRAITIASSNDQKEWRPLGYGVIYAIATPQFSGARLSFEYPESNTRYLKITIVNRDDRPIAVAGISLFGLVRNVVFRLTPGAQYTTYLGNPSASRPQYDIEYVSRYVDTETLHRVAAGPVEKNPTYIPPVLPKKPLTERAPYLLSAVLGIIVALLAFFLFRMMKQAKRL
ncbi:MAG: DUF3999 family protein [Patescibacteria group bacterium]